MAKSNYTVRKATLFDLDAITDVAVASYKKAFDPDIAADAWDNAREAIRADYRTLIISFYNQLDDDDGTPKYDAPYICVLENEDSGQIVGMGITGLPVLDDRRYQAYPFAIHEVALDPAYMCQGLGKILMHDLAKNIKERAGDFCAINVCECSGQALAVLYRFGGAQVDKKPYYRVLNQTTPARFMGFEVDNLIARTTPVLRRAPQRGRCP